MVMYYTTAKTREPKKTPTIDFAALTGIGVNSQRLQQVAQQSDEQYAAKVKETEAQLAKGLGVKSVEYLPEHIRITFNIEPEYDPLQRPNEDGKPESYQRPVFNLERLSNLIGSGPNLYTFRAIVDSVEKEFLYIDVVVEKRDVTPEPQRVELGRGTLKSLARKGLITEYRGRVKPDGLVGNRYTVQSPYRIEKTGQLEEQLIEQDAKAFPIGKDAIELLKRLSRVGRSKEDSGVYIVYEIERPAERSYEPITATIEVSADGAVTVPRRQLESPIPTGVTNALEGIVTNLFNLSVEPPKHTNTL